MANITGSAAGILIGFLECWLVIYMVCVVPSLLIGQLIVVIIWFADSNIVEVYTGEQNSNFETITLNLPADPGGMLPVSITDPISTLARTGNRTFTITDKNDNTSSVTFTAGGSGIPDAARRRCRPFRQPHWRLRAAGAAVLLREFPVVPRCPQRRVPLRRVQEVDCRSRGRVALRRWRCLAKQPCPRAGHGERALMSLVVETKQGPAEGRGRAVEGCLQDQYCRLQQRHHCTSNYEVGCYNKVFQLVETYASLNDFFYALAGLLGLELLLIVGALLVYCAKRQADDGRNRRLTVQG
uniref:Tetraspanin n=1 Tax=Macrostomum lignano TaxID=282301 RepID=A0A1I8JS94_9PLAT